MAAAHKTPGLDRLDSIRVRDAKSARWDLFPDFLILGPQRTGTTWLYHNLKKHPQVFLPRFKETYFFSTLGKPDHCHFRYPFLEDFLGGCMSEPMRRVLKRHYDCLRKYGEPYRPILRGEATATNALLEPEIIREILAVQPDLKAILMLRDPVERTWSHARKDLIRGKGISADEVTEARYEKFFRASGQRRLASFTGAIRDWGNLLKPGHLFVGEFESIAAEPAALILALQQFLGIRPGPKYFNRHLGERINPAGEGNNRKGGITPHARRFLDHLLAREIEEYRDLTRALRNPDEKERMSGLAGMGLPRVACLEFFR